MLKVEKIPFAGWPSCIRLSNGILELIATTDIGPRILSFSWKCDRNQLAVIPETAGQTGGKEWRLYGGHRLWNAPEHFPNSYYPDNGPIDLVEEKNSIRLVQPIETTTKMQKEMEIHLSPSDPSVSIHHRLINRSTSPQSLAPWAITAFAAGGVGILPFTMDKENPAPKPSLVISAWDYTELADPRLQWQENCLLVRQDEKVSRWLKMGVNSSLGRMAYLNGRNLFIKKFKVFPQMVYADNGSTSECWTNNVYLELESLSPLQVVQPGQFAEHVEEWTFIKLDSPVIHLQELMDQVLPLILA